MKDRIYILPICHEVIIEGVPLQQEKRVEVKISFKASVPRQIWFYAMQQYLSRIIKQIKSIKIKQFQSSKFSLAISLGGRITIYPEPGFNRRGIKNNRIPSFGYAAPQAYL
ncbi:hypothetical protein BpHYR1_044385 [Brachionus plicatilis]|uniref:Uncharacterized protein n=1 Tax=Brachionus plicatilis TaxID=10195 RepID=A0A3M7SW18_BRAPC|nr:hypothetical protein BpHYR1_044385 [Brachionus plicatilis]